MLSYTLAINGVSIGLVGRVLASYKIAPAFDLNDEAAFYRDKLFEKVFGKTVL